MKWHLESNKAFYCDAFKSLFTLKPINLDFTLRKKMSNVFDKSWEPAVSVTVSLFVFVSVTVSVSVSLSVTVTVSLSVYVSVDPCYMLNNFCFHVYAQK